jgi:hypothetical protein
MKRQSVVILAVVATLLLGGIAMAQSTSGNTARAAGIGRTARAAGTGRTARTTGPSRSSDRSRKA